MHKICIKDPAVVSLVFVGIFVPFVLRAYPRRCPTPPATLARMRDYRQAGAGERRAEIVASFGDAQIVKHYDGRLEICGGSDQEKSLAHDWMKKFLTTTPLTVQRIR